MDTFYILTAALIAGWGLMKLKVPGGMMVGAAIGAGILSLSLGIGPLPPQTKTIAQIVVGAFIGSGINREELSQMKRVIKPALIIIFGLLSLNILSGFLIHTLSGMDLLTAFMCTTPGGISDMPIVAAEMGADASKVLVMQFIRFTIGIGIFPSLIGRMTREEVQNAGETLKTRTQAAGQWHMVLLTLTVAALSGILGKLSGLPASTMAFSTIGTIVFKLTYPKATVPSGMRRAAQCLSGAYIGASIGWAQLRELIQLPLPIFILLLSLLTGSLGIGYLLFRMRAFTLREGMLAATPAGASDMVLISADLGIRNMNLVLLHVLRVIVVITFFPPILHWISHLAGQ